APLLKGGQRIRQLEDEGAALFGVERPPLRTVVVKFNKYLVHEDFLFRSAIIPRRCARLFRATSALSPPSAQPATGRRSGRTSLRTKNLTGPAYGRRLRSGRARSLPAVAIGKRRLRRRFRQPGRRARPGGGSRGR